jgi:hypothetical protein
VERIQKTQEDDEYNFKYSKLMEKYKKEKGISLKYNKHFEAEEEKNISLTNKREY